MFAALEAAPPFWVLGTPKLKEVVSKSNVPSILAVDEILTDIRNRERVPIESYLGRFKGEGREPRPNCLLPGANLLFVQCFVPNVEDPEIP